MNLFFLLSVICLYSCSVEDEFNSVETELSQEETKIRIENLENEYGVAIGAPQNVTLTEQQLREVESEIIKMNNYFAPFHLENTGIEENFTALTTRSRKTVTFNQWIYNICWLNIAASIVNGTTFELESWLTGFTVYSYHQYGLSHDFKVYAYEQTTVSFAFTATFTIELLEMVGIQITLSREVFGGVDFATHNGYLTVK